MDPCHPISCPHGVDLAAWTPPARFGTEIGARSHGDPGASVCHEYLFVACLVRYAWEDLLQWIPMDAVRNPQLRSTSVHKRHIFGPEGDTSNKRVRMSNLLASNMACFLELLSRHRSFWFIVEQPSSSYLFKMEFMLALSALLFCKKIHTWNLVLCLGCSS